MPFVIRRALRASLSLAYCSSLLSPCDDAVIASAAVALVAGTLAESGFSGATEIRTSASLTDEIADATAGLLLWAGMNDQLNGNLRAERDRAHGICMAALVTHGRVGMWRGGFRLNISVPPLSSGGALVVQP